MARIATVFLATGVQGTSVVQALLEDGTFKPRAVTRNANSDAGRSLAALGAEVVEAIFDDKDALKRAVSGTECVFLATIPTPGGLPELAQGRNVIEACKEAGVKFVVLSSLPSLNELSHGKYTHALHFDHKAALQKDLEESGIPCASVCPGSFLENISRGMLGCPFEETETHYILHTREVAGLPVVQTWTGRDMGRAVVTLFTQYDTRGPEIIKKTFVLGCQRATTEETAAELAKGLGKPVEVQRLGAFGIPPIDEMWAAAAEFDWYPGVDVPDKRLAALGVEVGTIEGFGREVLKGAHVEARAAAFH
ncbi:NAD(P)-binding protein [Schizophyllum commune Tattone D]|nr:NAD(P)-binding protein [Schizophyllum commune Tattone D]